MLKVKLDLCLIAVFVLINLRYIEIVERQHLAKTLSYMVTYRFYIFVVFKMPTVLNPMLSYTFASK